MTRRPQRAGRRTLRIEGLSVARGARTVVREVSLTIPPGEVTALLGPNGAGKSTLVLAVARRAAADAPAASCSASATSTRRRPERIRAAGVAVVPEGRRLLPELTVEDNLRVATYSLAARTRRGGHRVRARAVPGAARSAGTCPARSLSGGEQQMVVLAQALVSRPTIVLVDELSLGLAPVVVKRLVPTLARSPSRASACC